MYRWGIVLGYRFMTLTFGMFYDIRVVIYQCFPPTLEECYRDRFFHINVPMSLGFVGLSHPLLSVELSIFASQLSLAVFQTQTLYLSSSQLH